MLGIVLLLLVVVFIVLPMLVSTEQGREKLAEVLSESLHREVTIGDLDVGLFFSSIEVSDLRIANPPGYPEGAFLEARRLDLDAGFRRLLGGVVEGSLEGDGLKVHVIRKGDGSNLDGFGGERKKEEKPDKEGKPPPDLDLRLDLKDSTLTIENLDKNEKVVVEGVGCEMRLTNREGQSDATMKLRIRSLDQKTLKVTDIEMDARQAGDFLDVEKVRAKLQGTGTLDGSGRMRVRGGDDWNAKLDVSDVGIDEDLMPVLATIYPFAANAQGQMTGAFSGSFDLRGNGLTWEAMKPTLAGNGRATLSGMSFPAESLLVLLISQAGGPSKTVNVNNAGAEFRLADGWVEFNRLSASLAESKHDLSGRVSLDGELDLKMDLMPLVKQYGGGDAYAEVGKYTDKLEVPIGGTTSNPQPKFPKLEDLAKGAVGKALEGGLGDLFGGKKKK
jgi:uncharacterized protein involved in outer membrane biogenesis